MAYTPTTWVDELPATTPVKYKISQAADGDIATNATIAVVTSITPGTPLNAANLNHMEQGIKSVTDDVVTVKSDMIDVQADVATLVATAEDSAPAIFTAYGDLFIGSSTPGVGEKLARGANEGMVLKVVNGLLVWTEDKFSINIPVGNGQDVIPTGLVAVAVQIPQSCTLEAVRAVSIGGVSGNFQLDIWKCTFANWPPTDANSITSSTPVVISSSTKSENTTLTNWTKSFAVGDWLCFYVDSVTSIKCAVVSMTGRKA